VKLSGWQIFSLTTAALLGGYALATAAGIFIAAMLPTARSDAVLAGNMLSFFIYSGAVLWVFSVCRPLRVWLLLILSIATLAGAWWLTRGSL